MSIFDNRVFLADIEWYGSKVGTVLGLQQSSAVVAADNGKLVAYFGPVKDAVLVDPETATNAEGDQIQLPVDFRKAGVQILTAMGVDSTVQARMFERFLQMEEIQRRALINEFASLDAKDSTAVTAFAQGMIAALG